MIRKTLKTLIATTLTLTLGLAMVPAGADYVDGVLPSADSGGAQDHAARNVVSGAKVPLGSQPYNDATQGHQDGTGRGGDMMQGDFGGSGSSAGSAIPEPGTVGLFSIAGAALLFARRRFKR